MQNVETQRIFEEIVQAAAPRFELHHPLDVGGQGAVFEGTCEGTPAAVKLFFADTERKRIDRELTALRTIDCPSLVKVLGSDYLRVQSFEIGIIAYELIAGGDLRRLRTDGAQPTCAAVLAVAADVADAMNALWVQRIVHRDIKPQNILVRDGTHFVLADLGLARHLDLSDVTAAGFAPGTRGFKSPEQAAGRRFLTVKSDTFALGITLYWLASGMHPFNADQKAINEGVRPTPLSDVRPDLPLPLTRAIDGMMAFQADDRLNVGTLFRDLQERDVCSI